MWRAGALASGLVVIACGGIVAEDGSENTGANSTRPAAGSEDGAAGTAGTYGAELPATCGEWIQAVTAAADRCGTFLYPAPFVADRALSPELAREVCMPALRDTGCDSSVQGYMPDACKDACR